MSGASYGQNNVEGADDSSEMFALDPGQAKPPAEPPATPAPVAEPAPATVAEPAPVVPASQPESAPAIEVPPAAPLPEPAPVTESTPVAEPAPASEPTPAPEPASVAEPQTPVEPPATAVPESAAVTEPQPSAEPTAAVTEPQPPVVPAAEAPTAELQPPATPTAAEPQPPAEPSAVSPNIFERQGLGYRITYPADWVYEAPTQYQIVFSGKQGTPAYYSTVSVQNVAAAKLGGKHDSVDSVKKSLVDQLTTGSTETKIYDEKPYAYVRADKPALQGVEFMAEYVNNKEKFKQWIIIVERPGKEVYHIWSYTSPAEQYDSFIAVANDMLDSWMIK